MALTALKNLNSTLERDLEERMSAGTSEVKTHMKKVKGPDLSKVFKGWL